MLTGTSTGKTRADIITQATEAATLYYGTNCVQVTLNAEDAVIEEVLNVRTYISFTASWEATSFHELRRLPSGFRKCIVCNEDFQ